MVTDIEDGKMILTPIDADEIVNNEADDPEHPKDTKTPLLSMMRLN